MPQKPTKKKQADQQDSDNEQSSNNDDNDSQNQLKINTDNSPKIIPVAKLPEKLKCKKIIINVSDTQYPIVAEIGQQLGWIVQEQQGTGDWDVWWTDRQIQANTLYRMNLHQKINHFPGIFVLARKNLLGLHLMAMQRRFPDEYNFFPQTWMLPMQFHTFRQYYQSVQENKVRTYIVKPQALSQGRGIFLTRNIQDVINGHKYVIQKYMKNPLLLDGLKFDLRIYVLLAGTDPLRLYIYDQGLARLATRPYQPPTAQNMHENYIHLTNYSLNKTNPEYVYNKSDKQMDTGHKRSLKSVYQRLAKSGGIDVDKLKIEIEQSIVKTVISGLPSIRHQYKYCQPEDYQGNMCFHILGFDVMILDDHKPIVIEVNHTPSFQTGTPLDYLIKKGLIKDTLKLMRVSQKQKKELFLKSKELTKKRVQTGKRDILKGEERRVQLLKYQLVRDQQQHVILYDQQKPSGYKVIFPFKQQKKNEQYMRFYEAAQQVMKQLKDTRKKIISEQRSSTIVTKQNTVQSSNIGKNLKCIALSSVMVRNGLQQKDNINNKGLLNGRDTPCIVGSNNLVDDNQMKIVQQQQKQQQITGIISNGNGNDMRQQQQRRQSGDLTENVKIVSIKNSFLIRGNNNNSNHINNNNINNNNKKLTPPTPKQHITHNNLPIAKQQHHNHTASNISTLTNFKSQLNHNKYMQLMNKFATSKDLLIDQQQQNHDKQRVSLQGEMMVLFNQRHKQQMVQLNKNMYCNNNNLSNVFFDIRQKGYLPNSNNKQQIVVPIIKGYKQKVMASIKNQILPIKNQILQIKNTTSQHKNNNNQVKSNLHKTNDNNKNNKPSRHHVEMNFINLSSSIRPSLKSDNLLLANINQQQIQQRDKKLKKYGKFIKPQMYNLYHNTNGNNIKSIISNKYQTEAIMYQNRSTPLPQQNYHSTNYTPHLSSSHIQIIDTPKSIIPKGTAILAKKNNSINAMQKRGCSLLLGTPGYKNKNKSSSIISKVGSNGGVRNPVKVRQVLEGYL